MLTIAYLADHHDAVPVLADWFSREWGRGRPGMEAAAIAERLAAAASRDTLPICLLGLLDGEPVATASLKFREIEFAPEADYWLGSVYVREDCRGRGFGREIVAAAEAVASAAGFTPLYLYSRGKESLYSELGWTVVARTTVTGRPAAVMTRMPT